MAVNSNYLKEWRMIMENVITQESSKDIEFNYYLPVNIVFGSGKVNKAGELA